MLSKCNMKIVGVQDFALSAPAWLDEGTSVSWLRAWEKIAATSGHQMIAVLREHNYDVKMLRPVRGVTYWFAKTQDKLLSLVIEANPDIVFYNTCFYPQLPKIMQAVRLALPNCKQIVRTHHEVKRVMSDAVLQAVLANADHVIVSTQADVRHLMGLQQQQQLHHYSVVPFGVDVPYFLHARDMHGERGKQLDILASCSCNPVKNLPLLNETFDLLQQKGLHAQNTIGQAKARYAQLLCSSRLYFAPSTSEASGSRSLLEAYACGAYPVVSASCASACEVVKRFGGASIIETAHRSAAQVASELAAIVSQLKEGTVVPDPSIRQQLLSSEFNEAREIARIMAIVQNTSAEA
jgi:hypothetical protein